MKVLDLFCGMGGLSQPWINAGDEVWGIDIEDKGYPGMFIRKDVRDIDGKLLRGFDVIQGSAPCVDFSTASLANKGYPGRRPPDPERGLELIHVFMRIVEEAKPRYWYHENVRRARLWYKPEPIWTFKVSKRGWRCIWGNFPVSIMIDYRSERRMELVGRKEDWAVASAMRAKIPYPIAEAIRNAILSS